jgi:hypothetical protein
MIRSEKNDYLEFIIDMSRGTVSIAHLDSAKSTKGSHHIYKKGQ